MKKYTFWGKRHQKRNIALNENLSIYAMGDSLWEAILTLCELKGLPNASENAEETDINYRLKMFRETGLHKIEIFVEDRGKTFAIRHSNTASLIKAQDEKTAIFQYLGTMARYSLENKGAR